MKTNKELRYMNINPYTFTSENTYQLNKSGFFQIMMTTPKRLMEDLDDIDPAPWNEIKITTDHQKDAAGNTWGIWLK